MPTSQTDLGVCTGTKFFTINPQFYPGTLKKLVIEKFQDWKQ
jgi:hypothetical protein